MLWPKRVWAGAPQRALREKGASERVRGRGGLRGPPNA